MLSRLGDAPQTPRMLPPVPPIMKSKCFAVPGSDHGFGPNQSRDRQPSHSAYMPPAATPWGSYSATSFGQPFASKASAWRDFGFVM